MTFGLASNDFSFIQTTVVEPLRELNAKVYCYGSRARGDHSKFSDLDLMVESEKDLSKVLNQIKEQITNSNFPYKVDLVQLSEFAESYKNQYQSDKVLWVKRS